MLSIISAMLLSTASAVEVELEPIADATLYRNQTNTAEGAGGDTVFSVGTWGPRAYRGLVQFDLSSIPSDAIVNSAEITLRRVAGHPAAITIDVTSTTEPWVEGTDLRIDATAGSPSTGGATWNFADFNTDLWATPGGSPSGVTYGSASVSTNGFYTFTLSPALIEDILDGTTPHHGFLFTSPGIRKIFTSREGAAADRPLLTIDYTPGDEPPPPPPPVDLESTVDDMARMANNAWGSTVIDEAATAVRLRPSTLVPRIEELVETLRDGGCTLNADPQYWSGGRHNSTADLFEGFYNDGTLLVDGELIDGTISLANAEIGGEFDGLGVVGGTVGTFNSGGQFAADLNGSGFFAGRWVRVIGTQGVWIGVQGTCDAGPPSALPALDVWYLDNLQ